MIKRAAIITCIICCFMSHNHHGCLLLATDCFKVMVWIKFLLDVRWSRYNIFHLLPFLLLAIYLKKIHGKESFEQPSSPGLDTVPLGHRAPHCVSWFRIKKWLHHKQPNYVTVCKFHAGILYIHLSLTIQGMLGV